MEGSENPWTDAEMKAYRRLVLYSKSTRPCHLHRYRLEMPRFIEKVGKEKFDLMVEALKREKP